MTSMSITEAKRRLHDIVRRVAAGEAIEITRRGQAVARLNGVPAPSKRIDAALLRTVTESMPRQAQSGAEFVREMLDGDRY